MDREKCGLKIVQKACVSAGQGGRPRDENIVMALPPIKGQQRRGCGPQPPLGPVSRNRVADLAAGGKPHPDFGRLQSIEYSFGIAPMLRIIGLAHLSARKGCPLACPLL
jgi:hypothetical protein